MDFGKLTLSITVYSLATYPIPIILALLINEIDNRRFRKMVQMVSYAPHFVSTVVVCSMLILFTDRSNGLFNHIIRLLGGTGSDWLSQPSLFPGLYVWSGVWQNAGWNTIIYIAALAGVSTEMYEAARIDSASSMMQLHTLIRKLNHDQRRIILGLNGHSHVDGICVREGVPMMNINSASNFWHGHQYASIRYSETISRLYPHIKGCAPYWDALFAIIEIDRNAITVTGRTSSFVGAGPHELGFPVQENYHRRTPCIQNRILPMTAMKDTDHL